MKKKVKRASASLLIFWGGVIQQNFSVHLYMYGGGVCFCRIEIVLIVLMEHTKDRHLPNPV